MILTTEYDISAHKITADVESLTLSIENTITKTVTVSKIHISYNKDLIDKKLLINHNPLNNLIVS